jgi:hypothetical protein
MLRCGTICSLVLVFTNFGWAGNQTSGSESSNPQVVVSVYDDTGVSARILLDAEKEASRVFRELSVGLSWVNCRAEDEDFLGCRQPITSTQLFVRVVRRGRTLPDDAFGVAFLGVDGNGRYADVFLDRVRRLQAGKAQINEARVLGYVMAHEIGHLLLGSNAHSTAGIMEPSWSAAELRKIEMGRLAFTKTECEKMRRRVEARSRRVSRAITLTAANF